MKIVECPRDAMQGIVEFIPTASKIEYVNQLLKVGFDTIDFGSFVSAKAIPQMRDTIEVLRGLDLQGTRSSLLAIVANTRGAEEASAFDEVGFLGFPLSISETFQRRNTKKSIPDALNDLAAIKELCDAKGKKLVTYISMGFGNPYGDPYDAAMVQQFTDVLLAIGTDVISVADTVGAATPDTIRGIMSPLLKAYPNREIGVHLHSSPEMAKAKVMAAIESGCTRIDGALRGLGGCPMAKDDLVGNIATENVISVLDELKAPVDIDRNAFAKALDKAAQIFPNH